MLNDRYLRACWRQPVDCTPVWLMRQAGRYMPEYRAVREKYGFLEMVKRPEVAAEITLQPINAFDIDAGIIFADILPPLEGMGLKLTFEKGEGPVIHNPIKSTADIEALRVPDTRESNGYTLEAIRLVKREIADKIPLIGFSGAPFTLASYAIEGGSSKDFRATKILMYRQPEAWKALMTKLTALVSDYLVAQAEAGADSLQIFDSWAGVLSPGDFAEYVLPYVQDCIATVREQTKKLPNRVPLIYFGTEMNGMFKLLPQTKADVIGADWRIDLDAAWNLLGPDVAIQGNLDPCALFGTWPEVERRAKDVLTRVAGRPGHIFNLGHGIMTETPVENVARLVEFVHAFTATGSRANCGFGA